MTTTRQVKNAIISQVTPSTKRAKSLLKKAKWLAGASALAASTSAMAAPPLIINNVGAPTQVGSGQGKRAIWTNAGSVGGQTVDIVGVITTATLNHNWSTTSSRPSIVSVGQDDIQLEWRLYRAGTYDINNDTGGQTVVADIHVQVNDVDGPNNEEVFVPVCAGDVQWVRIDASATTGRAFGTVAGQPEIFSLIGDRNYNNQPASGLEIFYPDRSIFKMGRTANSGFLIRLDNPTYSAFDTLDFECADFAPPVAADDSQEGTPGNSTSINILNNDSNALENNNPTNNNSLAPSEFARDSVNLVPPAGATGTTTDSNGRITGFAVPNEGTWAYNKTTGALTFTPDPSFVGYATTVDYTFTNALGIASNQATVTVWYPGIGVTKSSSFNDTNSDGFGQVGETIDYIYQVKSYGAEPLQNINISETGFTGAGTAPTPAYSSGDADMDNQLDLTETWIYTASYSLIAADLTNGSVTNSATGSGQTAGGTSVSDVSDSSNAGDGNGTATSGPGPNNDDPTQTALPAKPIAATNDSQSGTIFSGGAANAFNIFDNDSLNSIIPTPSTVDLTVVNPASHAGVTLDTATGEVSVAPGTPAGNYSIDYQICEIGNPTNCAAATANVVVSIATPISASPDSPAAVARTGANNIINALTNDQLGGSPVAIADVDLTVTTPASHAGVTLDTATGLVSVAPGTPSGPYTINYQICEKANPANCASSTINVVVSPNPINADDDNVPSVNGATGNPNAFNAFANDELNGSPLNVADVNVTITSPATPQSVGDPVPAMDPATGNVAVPAGTPAGTYTIAYQICEKDEPSNCNDATITIVVAAPPIAATTDNAGPVTTAAGGNNLINALDNDSLNGSTPAIADINLSVTTPASHAGVTLDTASGEVSVAPGTPAGNYTIAYNICENLNPANCAMANVLVEVSPTPISATADAPAPVGGVAGGNDIINAFANDSLGGSPIVVSEINAAVTLPATPATTGAPVPVLDPATGLVDVPANTPAGTYTINYQICEAANPGNCANSSITVLVTPANIIAANDTQGGVNGTNGDPSVLNLFDGDSIGGSPATPSNATLSVATGSSVPPQLNFDPATGIVGVNPNTPAGTYSFDYEICETLNPANCETATASVTVNPAPIAASNDDAGNVTTASGGANLINALTNDMLNNVMVDPAAITLSITAPASHAGVTLDPATGQISVAPGTPAGSYSIGYQICEDLNPANCANATVAIIVTASPIGAANDSPAPINGYVGEPNAINAFANDTLNGSPVDPADINATITSPASHAGVVMDPATGNVSVAPGTPAGTYTITYEICETINPANCETASVSVIVEAAPIDAATDDPAPVNGTDGADDLINALANDRLNGSPVNIADINVQILSPADPVTSGAPVPVLDPATGLVDVPADTPAGTYTIGYEICETLNPANCADSIITVIVTAAPIAAAPDTPPAINGATGNPALVNAFDNDELNGNPVDPADISATILTPATPASPGAPVPVLDPATGLVSVVSGTPAGTYTIEYEICENLNPSNCAVSTVTVEVEASPIAAAPDTPPAVNGANGGDDIINAFDNDQLNGSPVDPADIVATITNAASPATPGAPVPIMDPATGLVDVPADTPAGTYIIEYEICEALNPSNCANSSVTITVDAAPISATNDDAGTVPGIEGGSEIISAVSNDSLNSGPIEWEQIIMTITSPSSHPGVTLDTSNGLVSVAPNTPAGSYSIGYEICEKLNPTNCATATVAVVVQAAEITAAPDTPPAVNGANGGDDIINAFANDMLNGSPVDPAETTATITSPAAPETPGAPVPIMDPETGLVDVPPATPAGTYIIEYQICEDLNPTNCANSSVTVVVEPPAIVATPDTPAPVREGIGNPQVTNVFENDTLNGVPLDPALITATIVTPASNPGIMLDPATGNVSVAPDVPEGEYIIEYQICENLNPDNCRTAAVTITVEPPLSAVEGTVFTDLDGDGMIDPDEPRRAGWIVEIVRDGEIVGTAITDGNGEYRIEDILSGPGYDIVFRNPENNVVYDIIENVSLTDNITVVDQNQPIDPSGVFYDSVTRQPISGVTATLTGENGVPLPAICFVDASQANQTTGASGEYRFDIVPGAAPQCPTTETLYRISVTPPAGYAPGSTVLAPTPGPFDPTGLPAPVRINPDPTPPLGGDTPFYLDFVLETGDPDIINNHIALDPFLTRTPLIVTKTSVKRTASIGDLVPYEITVRNTENVQRADVTVVDILPAGMKYVLGTASVNGAAEEPVKTDRQLSWSGQIIPANGASRYNLTLVVGAGVTGGEKVNTALARNGADDSVISNRGTAVVSITPNAVFDCSELLGKVFEDGNRNGRQDDGEPGVPGVRLATVNGQLITTDEHGRYHIACAAVPDARIGSNFVLKVDTRTLPLGWDTTTHNPRSIRLTRGKFGELNFGVAPKEQRRTSSGASPVNRFEKGE